MRLVSSPIQLLTTNVLENWFDFHITAYRAKKFSFKVSQLVVSLSDKTTKFADHGVIYRKDVLTYTRGGNIIHWSVIAKFDCITELPFTQTESISR